jgi:hypothetical protein
MRPHIRIRPKPQPAVQWRSQTIAFVYELLDAHDDTARLADRLAPDPEWRAHLGYLRALQRAGRGAARADRARGR